MIIVVVAGNSNEDTGFYGPFERWESIKQAQREKLRKKYNENFWQLELERPAGEPSMSAAEWQAKDDVWIVVDRWRAVGPFTNKAAAAAWVKVHPLPRGILGLLQPEPAKATAA